MEAQFKARTKRIALETIRLIDDLPQKTSATVIGRQVVRSASSIGANYRAACRAKSKPDFINKLKIVEEEADETHYWLELMEESHLVSASRVQPLKKEVNEIIAMIVASIKTLRAKSN